jgi:hypothetical protein
VRCKRDIIFLANSRRNINDDQRTYLIGKRYKVEKKEHGNTKKSIKEQVRANILPSPDNESTANVISKQSKVSHQTVKNAEKFADAVDIVAENTGIKVPLQKIWLFYKTSDKHHKSDI